MGRNPDLEKTAPLPVIKMATETGTKVLYSRPPTAEEVQHAEAIGACPVCDVQAKGCWCRWCDGPRCGGRFWMQQRSALRTKDGDHHGIKVERCPTCVAAGRSA